ncbi:Cof-type HAD-IIB family hydrolase [Paenibacillus yanchengensis]|uniref:Cof-type HAD-IIB family hydrolase n=1 Tax=Paenibacillus yanchengensis TaxID=2035833 RepID=A0ABW4YFI1_9BACL
MYKLVAIDVDDTLLNDELIISAANQAALQKAVEQGVTITLATGRMYASAKQIARQINLDVPIITYQGALVKTLQDEVVLYSQSVPKEAAAIIADYAAMHQLHLQFFIDDQLYGLEDNEIIQQYAQIRHIPYQIETDYKSLVTKPLNKLLIIDEQQDLDQIAKDLHQLTGQELNITKSKSSFLEITHPKGTKGHALQFLAEHIGCTMEETIAIGDSWNDHDMIELAGLGVAMGNATPQLKAIADYITATNNDDGVKEVIDKFVLHS